jgi:hypothetical protein
LARREELMPGGRMLQCAMSLGTAVLGVLLLLLAGSSEWAAFGWVFLALGTLGVVLWWVMPVNARR